MDGDAGQRTLSPGTNFCTNAETFCTERKNVAAHSGTSDAQAYTVRENSRVTRMQHTLTQCRLRSAAPLNVRELYDKQDSSKVRDGCSRAGVQPQALSPECGERLVSSSAGSAAGTVGPVG